MNAAQILRSLEERGAHIAVEGERVRVLYPTGRKPPAELLTAASEHKAELRALVQPPESRLGPPTILSDEFEERAALVQYGAGVPREWAEGFARLDVAKPPVGFDDKRWRTLIHDGGRFLDRWGAEAARLGWSAEDVFGVHPVAPAVRYDLIGLVPLISGGDVVAINKRSATIKAKQSGATLTYLRTPQRGAIALWELA